MEILRAIEAGHVSRSQPGVAPVFLVGPELVNLKGLEREDV